VIVRAVGLTKRFGDLDVLRDISLSLSEGERLAILGPSGCGKTTLLRILLGLESASSGSIESSLPRSGYLPQETLLFPWKTVMENLELPLQVRGERKDERQVSIRSRLPRFGLEGFGGSYPHELSGGMRQRAALLRALLAGATSLVLDEPFGALDTLTRYQLQVWLSDLLDELQQTLLFVTHDLDEAILLSERVLVLSGRPASVAGSYASTLEREERVNRFGRPFSEARERLLRLITAEESSLLGPIPPARPA